MAPPVRAGLRRRLYGYMCYEATTYSVMYIVLSAESTPRVRVSFFLARRVCIVNVA